MTSTTSAASPAPPTASQRAAVNVYSVDELRTMQERQRELYDWDFSKEREFMENLFCTRFNFLLVAYSLFATAAATAAQNQKMFVAVSFAGAIVCFMVWLTIMRAFAKLDILFQIIYRSLPDHPMSVMDEETKKSGKRLFRVNPIIAYWVPAFCVLSLIAGGVASLVGAF